MTTNPRTEAEWKRLEGQGLTIQHKWHAEMLENELNAANERIKRLEEAADNLLELSYDCDCRGAGMAEARLAYRKAKETKP